MSQTTYQDYPDRHISEQLYKKNRELQQGIQQANLLANQIKEEKNKLESVLENIVDIVIFLGHTGKFITVNKAFEQQFGFKKEEIYKLPFNQIIKIYDGVNEITLEDLYKETENTRISKVVRLVGRKELYGALGIAFVYQEDGKKRTILTIHDKTKEHELEDMKLDFVSMAAHELRTPITSIRGYASVMDEEMQEQPTTQVNEWRGLLSRISISAEQLLALVENLLNVTKIEKGVLSISCKDQNWLQLIQESTEPFREAAATKNIQFQIEEFNPNLTAYVDKMRIEEVISNLVSNAITYTSQGGTVKIAVAISNDRSWIETSVIDNGEGIPQEAQKHLFEKFFRVSGPLEQGSKGNGLGLFIARSIVEMHGGKIWVESEKGKGAKFTFSVPLIEQKS